MIQGDRPVIVVCVLAAGMARRYGSDKLVASVRGRPLLEWTLDAVEAATDLSSSWVVVDDLDGGRAAVVRRRSRDPRTTPRLIHAPSADTGVRASIAAAVSSAHAAGVHGVIFVLGDDPLAVIELRAVLDQARRTPDAVVAVRRDPPVPHPVYAPLGRLPAGVGEEPDRGLQPLLAAIDVTWLEPASLAPPVDVDTPADLQRLETVLDQISRATARE